ncbi:MAG TPA: hypothetical protein VNH18_00050, partial [Bryobacteraceae bacterium]|nr:hypothetical protein [Bryobacteraceae bacterium]
MTDNTLLTIGLPESGKTTYLAALWHVAESEEVPGALQLDRLSDEIQHLNMIKNDWLLCQNVGRSSLAAEQFPTLWLKCPTTEAAGEIVFPDLDGELFRDQWKARQWPTTYDEVVKRTDKILLFIHPEKVIEPLSVRDMQRLIDVSIGRDPMNDSPNSNGCGLDLSILDDDDLQDDR